ncbi:MAG: hypothetical protein ACI4V1_07475 [Eubacteriales bacterium]
MTNNKYVNFILYFFMAFGAAVFLLMFLRPFKPNVFEPNHLYSIAASIFLNLLVFQKTFRANVPLIEYWVRRVLYIGFVAINTPLLFLLFDCIAPERRLIYFLTSATVLELLLFVIYLIIDRHTIRATLDEINQKLKNNREE